MPDPTMSARWHVVAEDRDMVTLHIALWNGCRVVLTAWKDDASAVMLLHGDQVQDFSDTSAGSFKAWLDQAQGRRA
jgi:hypothetical protein